MLRDHSASTYYRADRTCPKADKRTENRGFSRKEHKDLNRTLRTILEIVVKRQNSEIFDLQNLPKNDRFQNDWMQHRPTPITAFAPLTARNESRWYRQAPIGTLPAI